MSWRSHGTVPLQPIVRPIPPCTAPGAGLVRTHRSGDKLAAEINLKPVIREQLRGANIVPVNHRQQRNPLMGLLRVGAMPGPKGSEEGKVDHCAQRVARPARSDSARKSSPPPPPPIHSPAYLPLPLQFGHEGARRLTVVGWAVIPGFQPNRVGRIIDRP